MASAAMPRPRKTPIRANTPSRAPAVNSNASITVVSTTVVPMSGSAMTSSAINTAIGTSGTSRCLVSVSRFSLRASRSAPQSTSASLAGSDGWICRPPGRLIQRVAPETFWPTPGTRTSSSSANDASSNG